MQGRATITEKQAAVCRYVLQFRFQNEGHSPTYQQIADYLEWGLANVKQQVAALVRKGYLEKPVGEIRSIKTTAKYRRWLNRQLNRQTNPAIDEVYEDDPELFAAFTEDEWDELRSIRGQGGAMSRRKVIREAAKINENRSVRRDFDLLLANDSVREELIDWINAKLREVTPTGKGNSKPMKRNGSTDVGDSRGTE